MAHYDIAQICLAYLLIFNKLKLKPDSNYQYNYKIFPFEDSRAKHKTTLDSFPLAIYIVHFKAAQIKSAFGLQPLLFTLFDVNLISQSAMLNWVLLYPPPPPTEEEDSEGDPVQPIYYAIFPV